MATKLILALVAAFATTAHGAVDSLTGSTTTSGGVSYFKSGNKPVITTSNIAGGGAACTCYLAGGKTEFTSSYSHSEDLMNHGFDKTTCAVGTTTFTLPDGYWQYGFDCTSSGGTNVVTQFKIDGVAPKSKIYPGAAYDPSPNDLINYSFVLGATDYHGLTTVLAGTSKTPNPAYDGPKKVIIDTENAATTYKYKLDGDQATSWTTITGNTLNLNTPTLLAPGTHCLEILGTDLAGNMEMYPAQYCWTVETHKKETGCTFGFSVNGAEIETTSKSMANLKDLPDGTNTFTLMATDMYGNPTNEDAYNTFSWTVHTGKPKASFATSGTWGETELPTSTKGSFTYAADEAAFFKYQVDDGAHVLSATNVFKQEFPTNSFAVSKCAGTEHSFAVYAVDMTGNVGDMVKDSFTVEPINTYLTLANAVSGDVVNGATAVFTISAIVDNTAPSSFSYEYKVDGGSWQKGKHFPKFGVKGLAEGDHTITARAKNTDGCMDPTPVTISFTIDTTAPVTTLNGPVSPSNSKDVTVYGYVDDKSVSTDGTQYKLGADGIYSTPGVPTVPCAGCPDNTFAVQLTDLVEGSYTLYVKSTDMAGLTGEEAAVTWVVDMGPPETLVLTGPPTPQLHGSETKFRFACMENSCTFMYSVDGTGFVLSKEDHVTIEDLEEGVHTLQVYAVDAAGNADPTPAGYTWTIYTEEKYGGYCSTCSFSYKGNTPKTFEPISSEFLHGVPGPVPVVDPYADAEL